MPCTCSTISFSFNVQLSPDWLGWVNVFPHAFTQAKQKTAEKLKAGY
jgi:hypothetical protein